jgi:hypothetical protein
MGCEFLFSSPSGPKKYGPPKTVGCTIKTQCQNSEDLRDIITVECPGQKECKDWSEPWEDVYRCTEYLPCVKITIKRVPSTKTGTECGDCKGYAGGDCNCPDGYMKLSSK